MRPWMRCDELTRVETEPFGKAEADHLADAVMADDATSITASHEEERQNVARARN